MVRLDDEGDILVLRFLQPYAAEDETAYLAALGSVGRTDRRFALLAIFGGDGKLSPAGERAQALWFKATRARFAQHCFAIAMVRPGATPRMAEPFRKLWSMPLTVVDDEPTARRFLETHARPERETGA